MKQSGFMRPALIIVFGIVLLIAISLAVTTEGKIPITSKSKEALTQYLKGRDLAERLRGTDAREYFQKAVTLDPDFALGHLGLALVQPTAKGFFEHFNKALALRPEAIEPLIAVARSEALLKRWDDAEQRLTKVLEDNPNNVFARNLLGDVYYAGGKAGQAEAQFQEAVQS